MYQGDGARLTMTTETQTRTPGFHVEPLGFNRYRLQVNGDFTPGWLARLSAGLSEHQVSIIRGKGRRLRAAQWEADFEIAMERGGDDPRRLDFQAFVRSAGRGSDSGRLELESYRVETDRDDPKSVRIEVQGADKIGFLQKLLKSFALFSLFPCELRVETIGSSARDSFQLRGIAGSTPSREAIEGLKELLEDSLVKYCSR